MKLELARAMLYNADLLLLDEVRRYLDLTNRHLLTTLDPQPTNHVGHYPAILIIPLNIHCSWTAPP